MAGEELGFIPLTGEGVIYMIAAFFFIMLVPGFLLSLAIFPKNKDLDTLERFAVSLAFGLTPAFLITMLNITVGVFLNYMTCIIMALLICVIGLVVYVYRGGGYECMGKKFLK